MTCEIHPHDACGDVDLRANRRNSAVVRDDRSTLDDLPGRSDNADVRKCVIGDRCCGWAAGSWALRERRREGGGYREGNDQEGPTCHGGTPEIKGRYGCGMGREATRLRPIVNRPLQSPQRFPSSSCCLQSKQYRACGNASSRSNAMSFSQVMHLPNVLGCR